MVITMSAELVATIKGTLVTIVLVVLTIYLTNRSTKGIIKEGQENTQKPLGRLTKIAEGTYELQKDRSKCMLKIA